MRPISRVHYTFVSTATFLVILYFVWFRYRILVQYYYSSYSTQSVKSSIMCMWYYQRKAQQYQF